MLRGGDIELSPHLMLTIGLEEDFDFSYPFKTDSRCIMRPRPKTFTINFVSFIDWKLVVFVTAFIVIYEILWKLYPLYCAVVKSNYNWMHLPPFYMLWLFLGTPIPNSKSAVGQLRPVTYLRLFIVSFVIAFNSNYISQVFSSNLTSFLTANYIKGSASHLSDIFSAHVPIIMRSFDARTFARYHNVEKVDLKNFINLSYEDVLKYRNQLNTSYMYLLSNEKYQLIDEQQRYLNSQLFRLSKICHG